MPWLRSGLLLGRRAMAGSYHRSSRIEVAFEGLPISGVTTITRISASTPGIECVPEKVRPKIEPRSMASRNTRGRVLW